MVLYGYEFIRETDLAHHGIRGQKWGVRRFQNEDGTWTSAGKERYDDDSPKETKKEKRAAEINQRISSAKSASEMERAVRMKAKEDIRASQNPLSRLVNDITGYNNSLADRVVHDVKNEIISKDYKEQRSKMTKGQRFMDAFVTGAGYNNSASKYSSGGYKKLNKAYESYKSSGGLKKSRRNYDIDSRIAANQRRTEQRIKQREAERRYEQEKRKRDEDIQKAVNQMNYLAGVYERRER